MAPDLWRTDTSIQSQLRPLSHETLKPTCLSCTDEHAKWSFWYENWLPSPINLVKRLLLFSIGFESSPGVADNAHRALTRGPEGWQISQLLLIASSSYESQGIPEWLLRDDWLWSGRKLASVLISRVVFKVNWNTYLCVGLFLWKIQYAETTIAPW